MKLSRPSPFRGTADRLLETVEIVSMASIPLTVAAVLSAIATFGLNRCGLLGLFIGIVAGIPASLIAGTIAEALSVAVVRLLTKLSESTMQSE